MPKLHAMHPIRHDGKHYAPGATLTVADKAQAAQLIDSGAAALVGDKERAPVQKGNADAATNDSVDGAAASSGQA